MSLDKSTKATEIKRKKEETIALKIKKGYDYLAMMFCKVIWR
jgi:hypothetical protein